MKLRAPAPKLGYYRVIGSVVDSKPQLPELHRVTYTVWDDGLSDGTAELICQNEIGGTEQRKVSMPWNMEFKVAPGTFLYLSAQKQQESGIVTAAITIDGHMVKRAESDSPFGIAAVSGHVP